MPDPRGGAHPALTRASRVVGTAAAAVGTPAVAWLADPRLGILVTGSILALAAVVVLAALFGSREVSERAFRLLRWISGRAEPRPPATPPPPSLGPPAP
ncbi:hypothetical protein [Spongiactinospora sp. 9N601]|uniref:hypothetical protein n=1 Tax=Spongiactinospora sp. 9N601 TaxID=3375149 RepID=UPI003793C627